VSGLRAVPLPSPERLRSALRPALAARGRPLRVLAEGVDGIAGEIDLVAIDPGGTLVVVLVASDPAEALGLVARGLAERRSLPRRAEDWLKFAPDLGLRVERGVELLLLAPDFGAATRAAAAEAGPSLELVRMRFAALDGGAPEPLLESLEIPSPGPEVPRERPRLSVFRSGLDESALPESRPAGF